MQREYNGEKMDGWMDSQTLYIYALQNDVLVNDEPCQNIWKKRNCFVLQALKHAFQTISFDQSTNFKEPLCI